MSVPGVADQEVHVGIRPEGFELDPNGPMTCELNSVEVMGRDSSIVSTHPASQNPVVRAIIDADNKVKPEFTAAFNAIKELCEVQRNERKQK